MSRQLKNDNKRVISESPVVKTEAQEKEIKRTKKHEAILKIKQIEEHIDIMNKKRQALEVRDGENRSKTIQHERKIQQYQKVREEIKKDKESMLRHSRQKAQQTEACKQKFLLFKEDIQKKVAESLHKFYLDRADNYSQLKKQQELNQEKAIKIKEVSIRENQKKKKIVNEMQQLSKTNINRYKEQKQKQSNEFKESEYLSLMAKATNRQKQLEKLSKLEEEMIKKSSQSMQASQVMRRRLHSILGGQKRSLKLPDINMKNNSTRQSTSNTQIIDS